MPRMMLPCQRCGRLVDFRYTAIELYGGEAKMIIECARREKCDRPWSRWDRILNNRKHEVKMECERVAEDIFRVTSDSAHDKTYAVDLSVPNCSCTDWATKRNKLVSQARREGRPDDSVKYECKHVREAKLHMSDPILDQKAKTQKVKDDIVSRYTKDRTRENLIAMFEEMKDA